MFIVPQVLETGFKPVLFLLEFRERIQECTCALKTFFIAEKLTHRGVGGGERPLYKMFLRKLITSGKQRENIYFKHLTALMSK